MLLFVGALFYLPGNGDYLVEVFDQLSALLGLPVKAEVWITFVLMFVCCLPMLAYDLVKVTAVKKRLTMEEQAGGERGHRLFVKMIGLLATFGGLGFVYWLLPEYGSWYDRFWQLLWLILPLCLLVAPFYMLYADRRMPDPEDGYWHLGLWLLSLFSPADRAKVSAGKLAEHGRTWAIKGFFLPLMAIFLMNDVVAFLKQDLAGIFDSFGQFYNFLYLLLYSVDVFFAAIGYVMTLKILDTDIRSAEPSLLGWLVCIICYPPFWNGLLYKRYFFYNDGGYWGAWLKDSPGLYGLWGSLILVCIAVYVLATVSLGYRFSNLTYRGLTTTGVYRLTKHPAYVAKNLSWWLISIPFLTGGDEVSVVRNCLLLLGVNFIYFLRARTEERHLSHYSEYVAYAEWIDRHGIFRWVPWVLPFTRYSAERSRSFTPPWWKKKPLKANSSVTQSTSKSSG